MGRVRTVLIGLCLSAVFLGGALLAVSAWREQANAAATWAVYIPEYWCEACGGSAKYGYSAPQVGDPIAGAKALDGEGTYLVDFLAYLDQEGCEFQVVPAGSENAVLYRC